MCYASTGLSEPYIYIYIYDVMKDGGCSPMEIIGSGDLAQVVRLGW